MSNSIDFYKGIFLHVIAIRIMVPWMNQMLRELRKKKKQKKKQPQIKNKNNIRKMNKKKYIPVVLVWDVCCI